MSEKKPARVGHVVATIRGHSIRFELPRDPRTFAMIEHQCGPFSALWRRLVAGQHTTTDVRAILATAHPYQPRPIEFQRIEILTRLLSAEPEPPPPVNGAPIEVIDHLMAHIPFTGWETLAALIMAAAINGLAPELAVFTDAPKESPKDAAGEKAA